MAERRCAWNQQDVGRALQQPRQRHLHWRHLELPGDFGQFRGLQRREAAQRKVRHVRDTVARQCIDHGIVGAVREVEEILHAHDLADAAAFRDLRGRDVAEPDVAHQTLPLQIREHAQ